MTMKTIYKGICESYRVHIMERKKTLERLIILFGFIVIVITITDVLLNVLSITPDPVLSYFSQILYFLSIIALLLLCVLYLEVQNR